MVEEKSGTQSEKEEGRKKEVVEEKKEEVKEVEKKPKEVKAEESKNPNIIHAALFLHSAGQTVNEDNLKKVIKAAGVSVEDAQIKALVSNLRDVDIDKAIKQTAVMPATPSAKEVKKEEEKPKEEKKEGKKKAEEAVSGLSSLFG